MSSNSTQTGILKISGLWKMTKYIVVFLIALPFFSCTNIKKATYFNDMGNARFSKKVGSLEPVLQKNDILSITVSSLNPESVEMFNIANKTPSQGAPINGGPSSTAGYLIDQDGNIQFPFLGSIIAAGITKKDLRQYITKELVSRGLLLEPLVDIRYLNFKVSVLGEVNNPSVFNIPNERVTLLEALGLAGDMTIFAQRDNVFLISERDGVKTTKRIDLTSNQLFNSPNYYLKSNDIVYVQPNKRKVRTTANTPQWFSVVVGALSLAVISIASFR